MDPVASIGSPAPEFELNDLGGTRHSLKDSYGSIVVLNFWSADCTHSERADKVLEELAGEWRNEVVLWCIAANKNEDDDLIRRAAGESKTARILRDEDQQVADAYGAVTTPHVFVIDREGVLRYAGGLDDVSLRQKDPTRNYLSEAVESVRIGKAPDPSETAPFGCAIVRMSL